MGAIIRGRGGRKRGDLWMNRNRGRGGREGGDGGRERGREGREGEREGGAPCKR